MLMEEKFFIKDNPKYLHVSLDCSIGLLIEDRLRGNGLKTLCDLEK